VLAHGHFWRLQSVRGVVAVGSSGCCAHMFTIIPYGQGQIPIDGGEAADLLASVTPDTELCASAQRPFVQLSHQGIAEDDVEAVLGYAGITKANLRKTQPEVIAEYERHGSSVDLAFCAGVKDELSRFDNILN
jgi:hypothetical protein